MTAYRGPLKCDLPHIDSTDWAQLYRFTSDLLCLEFCRPRQQCSIAKLQDIRTPLRTDAWSSTLQSHPDRAFAQYITVGLRTGFRVGFQYGSPLRSAAKNMASAHLHHQVISDYLQKERSLGRMLGPFPTHPLPPLHINRFGVIPKGHNTGKWRLITDLSFPDGFSVNDGIDTALCSLSYTTIDDVASIVVEKGIESLLDKVDIESASALEGTCCFHATYSSGKSATTNLLQRFLKHTEISC